MTIKHAKVFPVLLAVLVSSVAIAAEDAGSSPSAIVAPEFSNAQVQQGLKEGVDLRKLNLQRGIHVVPLARSWASEEQARAIRDQIAQQKERGFYTAQPDEVERVRRSLPAAGLSDSLARLDQPFRTIEEVRPRLAVAPAQLGTSGLTIAMLQDVRIAGGLVNGKWTGVARSFDVPGLGMVILNETDHVAGNESVSLVEEWLNAEVNGHLGTAKTAHTRDGRVNVVVGWADDRKIYSLSLDPVNPELTEQNQTRLLEMARGLTDG